MSYNNGLDKPSDYFDSVLYTGNTSTGTTISSLDFAPNMVWFKSRTNAENHQIYDSVRGVTKRIIPNGTQAEATASTGLTNFDSNGFRTGGENETDSGNIVAWNWKAGGSASSNTDGSITSSVSANQDAGFSIVSYTGAGGSSNVGHGLGVAPNLIIAKNRESSISWFVSCDAIGWTKRLKLDGTNDAASNVAFGDTNPDSTKFYLQDNNLNTSGETHIAYCFAEKKGYSKFGSFVGSSSQQFIYLGFKPRWFLWKNTSQGDATFDHWGMVDTLRQPYNGDTDGFMRANQNLAESSFGGNGLFFLSNGIQFNNVGRYNNNSGDTYIYMAFAENPFVTSTGVPATAR